MDVTLSASTRGQTVAGQVIRAPDVEFSLFGQYEADVKFAYSLKLERRASDMPTVVLSAGSISVIRALKRGRSAHLSVEENYLSLEVQSPLHGTV